MRTGEMKYVILRIDTHVLRIDLCPRKRTRIRRQKQDEDVHLFLSERKKPAPPVFDRIGYPARPGFRPDRPHTRGFAPPGFRPGLWSTGPTARPGTGERPVGAPDHSQGRNPWAANPWAARIRQTPRQTPRDPAQLAQTSRQTPRDPARLAQTPRQTPRDLRGLRKRHGKCRETCAACANATANAARLARLAQTPRQMPRDLRGLRKRHGKPTGRKAPTTSTGPQGPNISTTQRGL